MTLKYWVQLEFMQVIDHKISELYSMTKAIWIGKTAPFHWRLFIFLISPSQGKETPLPAAHDAAPALTTVGRLIIWKGHERRREEDKKPAFSIRLPIQAELVGDLPRGKEEKPETKYKTS
jgi:hypothetical protein